MLNVVIVEDESKILRMLTTLINWKGYGFNIVSTAQDGISGKKTILQFEPDIVITDIRMPGCDGIELIKEIKDKLPKTEFIILSGYRHFEYAHNAISLGVKNYLLKPIDEGKLISILLKIKQSRELSSKQLIKEQAALEEIQFQRNTLRNNLILNLSTIDVFMQENSLSLINKKYCTSFKDGSFCVATLQFDNMEAYATTREKIFLPRMIELINKTYDDSVYDCVIGTSAYDITFILNFSPKSIIQISHQHNIFFDNAHILTEEYGSYAVTIGISSIIDGYKNLKQCYDNSIYALQHSLIDERDKIIFYDDLQSSNLHNAKNLFNENNKLQLLNIIFSNNTHELEKWIATLTSTIQYKDFYISSFYSLCVTIAEEVLDYFINEQKIKLDKSELIFYLNTEMVSATSINSLFIKLHNFLLHLLNSFTIEKVKNSTKMVQKAQKYIDNNFKNQIRLDDVGKAVNLNTTYLCGLFKSEVGITFSEYLTNKRMNAAKNLLRESELNIITIAMECGYNDVRHFSKLFTKTIGIRPTEYRNLYS